MDLILLNKRFGFKALVSNVKHARDVLRTYYGHSTIEESREDFILLTCRTFYNLRASRSKANLYALLNLDIVCYNLETDDEYIVDNVIKACLLIGCIVPIMDDIVLKKDDLVWYEHWICKRADNPTPRPMEYLIDEYLRGRSPYYR